MRWLCAVSFFLACPLFGQSQTRTVRIGVLGLFHPQQLTLSAERDSQLLVLADEQPIFLRAQSACSSVTIYKSATRLIVRGCGNEFRAERIHATGRNQEATSFTLAVSGKVSRRYKGVLEIKTIGAELVPVVTMELEVAVASTVRAETNPGTPMEALEAQAVVSRSYLSSKLGRHKNFDFCDLTHCQSLREPPAADSPAAQAASATQDLVLTFEGKLIATMFTRSCGGHTRTPQELGLPQAAYPYFSVECESCEKEPVRWTRKLSAEDAALLSTKGENGRLTICRRLGWDSVPSNNFIARTGNGEVILEGTGQGHGIGLCQRGAAFLARESVDYREILAHYFPKTRIAALDSIADRSH